MKFQLWWCEICGALGAVQYKERADAMSVCHAEDDQHKEASPMCPNGWMGLRSIAPENIKKPFYHTVNRYTFASDESDEKGR